MGNRAFKIIVSVLALGGLIFVFWQMFFMYPSSEKITVRIGDSFVSAEVADTFVSRSKGLSGRESLEKNSGMLFVYEDKKIRNFWMKGMKIPLDIIWIADKKIIGIEENVPYKPKSGEEVRAQSGAPADAVLEVNSGWASDRDISLGDTVDMVEN